MDKKIRNRILYIAVACLWGIAIYRTYNNYQTKQENEELAIVNTPSISPIQFNKDTFELELPDKDPFLESGWTPTIKIENSSSNNSTNNLNIVKKEIVKPTEKVWPKIEYFGFVKNRNKNSTLCLLKIDGQLMQLSKGQNEKGILVNNVYKDSVLVVFDGERKTVRK